MRMLKVIGLMLAFAVGLVGPTWLSGALTGVAYAQGDDADRDGAADESKSPLDEHYITEADMLEKARQFVPRDKAFWATQGKLDQLVSVKADAIAAEAVLDELRRDPGLNILVDWNEVVQVQRNAQDSLVSFELALVSARAVLDAVCMRLSNDHMNPIGWRVSQDGVVRISRRDVPAERVLKIYDVSQLAGKADGDRRSAEARTEELASVVRALVSDGKWRNYGYGADGLSTWDTRLLVEAPLEVHLDVQKLLGQLLSLPDVDAELLDAWRESNERERFELAKALALEKQVDRPVTLGVADQTPADALAKLGAEMGMPIHFLEPQRHSIFELELVALVPEDEPAQQVLDRFVKLVWMTHRHDPDFRQQVKLDWSVSMAGEIYVGPPEEVVRRTSVLRVYDVDVLDYAPLLERPRELARGSKWYDANARDGRSMRDRSEQIVALVKKAFDVEAMTFDRAVAIKAPPLTHLKIIRLMTDIRMLMPEQTMQWIKDRMQKRVWFQAPQNLDHVFTEISQRCGVPLEVRWEELKLVGIAERTELELPIRGLSAKEAIEEILRHHGGEAVLDTSGRFPVVRAAGPHDGEE